VSIGGPTCHLARYLATTVQAATEWLASRVFIESSYGCLLLEAYVAEEKCGERCTAGD